MTDVNVKAVEPVLVTKLPVQVSQTIVDLVKESNAATEKFRAEKKARHTQLWEQVHSEFPDLDIDGKYSLDTDHIEGDIVILEVDDDSDDSGMPKSLKRILAQVLTR